jgi:hypothetical protein
VPRVLPRKNFEFCAPSDAAAIHSGVTVPIDARSEAGAHFSNAVERRVKPSPMPHTRKSDLGMRRLSKTGANCALRAAAENLG